MKHLFSFLSAILLLSACSKGSDGDEVIVEPDIQPIVTNTGELLSVDGSRMHIAYNYDEAGRVVYAERFDSSLYVVKMIGEYKYEADRIYITFQEFAEMPNGERNSAYSRDYVRDELTYVRDDNFKRNYRGKLEEKPWYTEIYQLEWQDGNVLRRTNIDPIHRDTTVCTYRYSSLTGSCIVSEPRNVLPDFEPLMQTGYFGKSCKNLFESIEAKTHTAQTAYQLDEQGKVGLVKSNVTWDDGTSLDYTYSIRWTRGN